jgi:MinD-like ATPase involved in chromosome partitioning or flagellar assembly
MEEVHGVNGITSTHDGQGNSGSGLSGYGAFVRPEPPPSNQDGADETTGRLPVPAAVPEPRHAAGQPPNALSPNLTRSAEQLRTADSADRPPPYSTLTVPDNTRAAPQLLTVPAEFGDIPTVDGARLRSTKGMRGALNRVGFRFGLSRSERTEHERRDRIRRPLPVMYQVAVLSVKGGVGKTTTAVTLASTFAKMRPDRVLAVDANPHFGDLATRSVKHPFGLTVRDLVQAPDTSVFSSVLAYTVTTAADLSIIASPWRSELDEPLSGGEFAAAAEILRHHFNLVLVDCGSGVLDSATARVLATSHALVVVASATFGGLNGAVATYGWLHAHGLQHLIARSVVAVINQHPVKPNINLSEVGELFSRAQRPTYLLPYDAHLAEGGPIDLRLLDGRTRLTFEELGAGLIDFAPTMAEAPR